MDIQRYVDTDWSAVARERADLIHKEQVLSRRYKDECDADYERGFRRWPGGLKTRNSSERDEVFKQQELWQYLVETHINRLYEAFRNGQSRAAHVLQTIYQEHTKVGIPVGFHDKDREKSLEFVEFYDWKVKSKTWNEPFHHSVPTELMITLAEGVIKFKDISRYNEALAHTHESCLSDR